MNLKRIVIAAGLSISVLLLGAVLYLAFADFSGFRPRIEALVSDSIGREFSIDGDFSLEVFPAVSFSIDDAVLANAEWASEPNMAEIGHLSARISLWSLLSRPIFIEDLRARDIRVRLERNAEGTGNWELAVADERDASSPPPTPPTPTTTQATSVLDFELPVDLRIAQIDNVSVEYRAAESEAGGLELGTFALDTADDGRHTLTGSGEIYTWPFSFEGAAGGRRIEFEGTFGEINFASSAEYPNDSISLTLDIGTLEQLGAIFEVEQLPAEQLSIRGNVGFDGTQVVLSDVLASLATAQVSLDGAIGGDSLIRLSLDARGPSLQALNGELPELPFSVVTELTADDAGFALDPFEATFGESDMNGSLRVAAGDVPAVTLRAASTLIDLTPFAPADEQATAAPGDGAADPAEAAEPAEHAEAEAAQFVFDEQPLPLEQLTRFAADIDVTVGRLVTAQFELQDLETVVAAADGEIAIENSFHDASGGRFDNRVGISIADARADLDLNVRIDDLRLGLFTGPDIALEQVPPTSVELDVTGTGASPRELAASANGRVLLTQGSGRVENDLIESMSGDVIAQLFEALNPFAAEEQYTQWDCSVFALDLIDGVGEITGMLLQSEKLTVVGRGEIDLNTEQLDIEFNTKPRSGIGVSADMFVTPFVKLSGTLAEPGVGANATGLLLSGGAAVLTGGMSFLYQGLLDRATAQADQCERVIEEVSAPAETQ